MSFIPADRTQNDFLSPELPVTSGVVALREASPISLHITEQVSGGVNIRVTVNPEILNGEEASFLLSGLQSVVEEILLNSSVTLENLFSLRRTRHAIVEGKHYLDDGREEWTI
jgi:hypothetical protein